MLVKGSSALPASEGGILLIQLGDIGDVVLTMPAIKALRQHFPHNELVLLVREHARELAEDCPWTDRVIAVDKQKRGPWKGLAHQLRYLRALRRPGFSLAIDLRTGTRGAVAAFLSGAPFRIGRFSDGGPFWRNRVFTHLVRPENELTQYASEHHLNILAPFGVCSDDAVVSLIVPDARKREARTILREAGVPDHRPLVAVHPFSLWRYKEWPLGLWASLIDWLSAVKGCLVVVTGAPSERSRAEVLTRGREGRVYNLAGRTSIGQLPALLERCRLFVGVDTAGLHIAAAVGVPTVGIFGPSSPACWAPRGERHCVVTGGMSCQPCRQKGCEGTERSRCLEELRAEQVIYAVEDHFDRLRNIGGIGGAPAGILNG